MEIIQSIKNLKVYDSTMFHLEDTEKAYRDYLQKLLESGMNERQSTLFLETLKNRELINNQETEQENSFLLELYKLTHRVNSIDLLIKVLSQGPLNQENFIDLHKLVIKGTSDDIPANYKYRSDNDKWVGVLGTNGEHKIDYIPPSFETIPENVQFILDYLNEDGNTLFDNVFIKPFIAHAFIAYLQPFGNGNTRIARLIQYGAIFENTAKKWNVPLNKPALYLSRNYLLTRGQYRGLIRDLSIQKGDNAWNKWFDYNLNMVDEQLYKINRDLDSYITQSPR